MTKPKTGDSPAVRARLAVIEWKLAALDKGGTKFFWWGVVISILLTLAASTFFAYVGVQWSLAATRDDHVAYIDARRPCLVAEELIVDLPFANLTLSGERYENERGETTENGTIVISQDGSRLHLYAIHLANVGSGNLRDLRIVAVLPGSAYATTTDHREAIIDVTPTMRTVVLSADGPKQADSRLTFARNFTGPVPLTYIMPSGRETPENWSNIFRWSPNIQSSEGNEIVTYSLPVLAPGAEWWIGTWYYQPDPDHNGADKGAVVTGWSQGYDGPLPAAAELKALYAETATGQLPEFCSWQG